MKCSRYLSSVTMLMILFVATTITLAQNNDEISGDLSNARPRFTTVAPRGHANPQALTNNAGIPGIDSLVNFNGHFVTPGIGPHGKKRTLWLYNMSGRPPQEGGTTIINAPIVPVSLALLNFDGHGHTLHYSATPFIVPTLYSPVFQDWPYSSSDVPTQFTDAVQRAEFHKVMGPNWHTLLNAELKTERTMKIPKGSYRYKLKPNGACCEFVLVDINMFQTLLFPTTPTDTTTPIGAAENAGDITTKDMSTFLFPNTYLYFNGNPSDCCVLGFHTYDFEPGDADNGNREKRYVLNYSSWITPGLFGAAFADVTANSHEIAESFNDPFVASDGVHNITPWWLSPNGNCQDNLEDGDVIEGLPMDTYPIKMNGRTYHPQNEPMLQWFEFQSPSTAINHTYSYPNEKTLTALSPREGVNCK
jgi:hypothetical protein